MFWKVAASRPPSQPTADFDKAQVLDGGQHRHGVLDELGIAKLADVKNRFAHRLEYRLMLVEHRLGARKPKRQLTSRRDLLDAAGRSVDDGPALLVELTADADDGLFIDAAEIDPHLGAGGRLDEPTLAEADGPDCIVVRQHRKHELARFRHCFGQLHEPCASALQSLGLLAPEIVHDQTIAGLDQVGRHAAAHAAGTDDSKVFMPHTSSIAHDARCHATTIPVDRNPRSASARENFPRALQDQFRHVQGPLHGLLDLLAGADLQLRVDLVRVGDERRIPAHGGKAVTQRLEDGGRSPGGPKNERPIAPVPA